jgi:hypothetical protein
MAAKLKYPIIDGKKLCGMCGETKPVDQFDKGRKHLVPNCKPCKAAWAVEYRQRPEVKERSREYHKQYSAANRDKINARERRWRKGNKTFRTRMNSWRRNWTAKEKAKAVAYKGGSCIACGYSACLAGLDFHHIDPLTKDGYGTGALKQHWSFEKNMAEVDKCVLLCCRCHREVHAGYTSLDNIINTTLEEAA